MEETINNLFNLCLTFVHCKEDFNTNMKNVSEIFKFKKKIAIRVYENGTDSV